MGKKVEEGPPQPASPPAPLQGERGVISLVALWGGAKGDTINNGVSCGLSGGVSPRNNVFGPLAQPI